MKLGVCIPNYGETSDPDDIKRVAVEAERRGFDSVWCTDHLLMPRNSGTPYERIFESVTTLSYVAGVTSKVRLGISSLITAMRNPVLVAKQLATIDNLSGGRIMLATSAGWNQTEFSNLGSNFHNRGKRLDESIRMIRALWNGETSFESKILNHRFHDVVFEPRPVQKHIPIWIAGNSMAAMKRAVKLGDGWHPNLFPLDTFRKMVADFRDTFPEARSKPIAVRVGLNPKAESSEYMSPFGERRVLLSGNHVQNKQILETLNELDVSYLVVALSPDGKASVTDQIDGMKMLLEDVR
jgi:probable F420-dependent oxidoreductase